MTTRFGFFQDMLSTVVERAATIPRLRETSNKEAKGETLESLAKATLAARSDTAALGLASMLLERYRNSDDAERLAFFQLLRYEFDINAASLARAAKKYSEEQSNTHYAALSQALKSQRRKLFIRLNAPPSSTPQLVRMREDLYLFIKTHPDLQPVDTDLVHLFRSWFNRGFLVLQPIDWSTPAHILEKIIAYEAVHEIKSWQELRQRLQPSDRRCYAFFHLAMQEEPLIFVQVALADHIPDNIQSVLAADRHILPEEKASAAVFYSISNCQRGLNGISFGNFLIKQVANNLKKTLPNINDFVTLSPIPNMKRWIDSNPELPESISESLIQTIQQKQWTGSEEQQEQYKDELNQLAAYYLLNAKRGNGLPYDPVAGFHLNNGARVERINFMADNSQKGIEQAAGMMVNYAYDLAKVEKNHEAFTENKSITTSKAVQKMLPS